MVLWGQEDRLEDSLSSSAYWGKHYDVEFSEETAPTTNLSSSQVYKEIQAMGLFNESGWKFCIITINPTEEV